MIRLEKSSALNLFATAQGLISDFRVSKNLD